MQNSWFDKNKHVTMANSQRETGNDVTIMYAILVQFLLNKNVARINIILFCIQFSLKTHLSYVFLTNQHNNFN